MRDHAIVSPRFWTGDTGRFLRQHPDAQRLAFYLMTCPSSNMIGLYYLPVPTICHELNMTREGASKALRRVSEGGFAAYDDAAEVVFVYEMARFQVGEELAAKDNRIKAVQRLLLSFRKSRFYGDFLRRYGKVYRLDCPTPFEGASDPLRSQDQDQDQDQEQIPPNPPPGGEPAKSAKKAAEADPLFARFWAAYPRKIEKVKALAAWKELKPDEALLAAMLDALAWQVRSEDWTKEGGKYVLYPERWLKRRRWEDEPPASKPGTTERRQPIIDFPSDLPAKPSTEAP